jgi:hypothetical protein
MWARSIEKRRDASPFYYSRTAMVSQGKVEGNFFNLRGKNNILNTDVLNLYVDL